VRPERGAAAVEAALVLCFIVLPLTFGVISYAYMLSFRQSISQAATEGIRAAVVAPSDAGRLTAAQDAINNALDSFGVSCDLSAKTLVHDGKTVGSCNYTTPASCTSCRSVTVQYNYRDNALLPAPGLGIVLPDSISYSASAETS
jgi:Flp pilus assembly protein TadG